MKAELEKAWNKAITDFLTTPPNDPTEREKLEKVIEATQRAAGLVKPLR